jgi:phage terminase small subunit
MALSDKQRRFIDAYLGEARFNATKAAVIAGYPERSARSVGSENLSKPDIRAEIDRRLDEAALGSKAVLSLLAEQATATLADFISDDGEGGYRIDLDKAEAAGKLHLVNEFSRGRNGTKIKLYSAQSALETLGRHHKLFTDKVEHSGKVEVGLSFEDALKALREPDGGADNPGADPGV